MSLFGDPEGTPCCCSIGCCPGYVLPDCVTLELVSSCCEGDMVSVVLTKEDAETCDGGAPRPLTAAEGFCGGSADIIYSGALPSDWCAANDVFDATVLVFCCIDPATGEKQWWIYIADGDLGHNWYPAEFPRFFRLTAVSCDPFLLVFGNNPPDCSAEECIWTWQAICFVRGTLVRTPLGDKPIEDLKVGDEVIDVHGETVIVTATIPTEVDLLMCLTAENGDETGVTPEHPFMKMDLVSTVEAKDIQINEELPFGKRVIKSQLFRAINEKFEVYNISVTGSNTFIADGFAVHNKGQS